MSKLNVIILDIFESLEHLEGKTTKKAFPFLTLCDLSCFFLVVVTGKHHVMHWSGSALCLYHAWLTSLSKWLHHCWHQRRIIPGQLTVYHTSQNKSSLKKILIISLPQKKTHQPCHCPYYMFFSLYLVTFIRIWINLCQFTTFTITLMSIITDIILTITPIKVITEAYMSVSLGRPAWPKLLDCSCMLRLSVRTEEVKLVSRWNRSRDKYSLGLMRLYYSRQTFY